MIRVWQPGFTVPGQISGMATGDGVSTVLKVNLNKNPFSMAPMNVFPDVIAVMLDIGTGTASIEHVTDVGDVLTLTWDEPLADEVYAGFYLTLQYNSLP